MKAGAIVLVDWRDALPASGEPNKLRPAIIVGAKDAFDAHLPFEIVVPLSSRETLAISGASLAIEPTSENACTMRSFALAWNVQSVPHLRITATTSSITDAQLREIRARIRICIGA